MHRVHWFTRAAVLAAACTVASTGFAQTPQTKPPATPNQAPANQLLSSDDTEFAKKAAEGGMKEVEHGKLVAAKATDPQVKAFANRLVKDHTAANNELKGIAKRKNIELPPPPPSMTEHRGSVGAKNDATTETKTGQPRDHVAGAEPWMSQTGREFDKAFIDAAVKDHQEDIKLFEMESDRGTDAQLKAFAKKSLPTLRAHLKQAQDLQQKLATSTQ